MLVCDWSRARAGGPVQHHMCAIFADSAILCHTFYNTFSFACSLPHSFLVICECIDSDQSLLTSKMSHEEDSILRRDLFKPVTHLLQHANLHCEDI